MKRVEEANRIHADVIGVGRSACVGCVRDRSVRGRLCLLPVSIETVSSLMTVLGGC